MEFNGLGTSLSNLARLSEAKSRAINMENRNGEKGKGGSATEGTGKECARELGRGWKISPSYMIKPGETFVMADHRGEGAIEHIWMTCHNSKWRQMVWRIYWDDEKTPSVEVPVGDFFCNGWCERVNVTSLPIVVNPAGGFNCYFEMPFRKGFRMEMTNLSAEEAAFYFQIDYVETKVPEDYAYFHASFRRVNPNPYMHDIVIADNIRGKGHYVGTYLAWQVNNNRWWGEGEIKFYIDGDKEFPTICGTGTEDYFGGAWNWEQPEGQYCTYSTPYMGMHQVIKPDGLYSANMRFGMYRWHVSDPVRFESDLKVTIQDLGWRSEGRYLPQQSDVSATAFWYQTEPHEKLPTFEKNDLEVI